MNGLMLHVERIVRPVRAFASRKLRMRQELLAHLQSALDEELARHGTDATTALELALRRLGDPGQLTRQLQQTVPFHERFFTAKIPLPRKIERLEQQAGRAIYGFDGAMTPGHTTILAATAGLLAGIPWYLPPSVRDVLTHSGPPPAHVPLLFAGILLAFYIIFLASYRFVFRAADPHRRPGIAATLRRAAIMLGLQIAYTFFVAAAADDRLPTIGEIAAAIAATLALLGCSTLIARWVASLRRPYGDWLTIDVGY